MHILFVHTNYPAQFGHIAAHLIQQHGFRCTFASESAAPASAGIERVHFQADRPAHAMTHYCARTFENQVRRSHALYEALRAQPGLRPDLIVGHTGFASTLYLRELFDCPIVNYFEYFYRIQDSDLDFRRDLPPCEPIDLLRARTRNATLLLDLDNCDAGYSPTRWQRDRLPAEYHAKVRVIFDGIDTNVWRPVAPGERQVGGWAIPPGAKVVTYVSRGLESMRGFDIFMRLAKRLCAARPDVVFLVIGEDRIAYGGDARFTGGKTFKDWVLSQDEYDLSRIRFVGRVPPTELARVFSLTDLHVYLTVPFVLSWSLMNALACGATILASDTAPVREMITHGKNGLLADFFDVEQMAETALQALSDPAAYRRLGEAGIEMIHDRYSLDKCLPQMLELYQQAASGAAP